ncbi:hypothetical protein D7X55_05490 [Corallococcus sp. AB049A]|uniref:Uncharacterized protein n=1 Tax=Corallococcus interemptor TaxID=2316720 RepID=A0A3A8QT81_9BACT|nr:MULTISPECIES: hypothetical protein [Corallococcus]RKH52971.1 hypothetical protein D7Y23_04800 [Corallococcus sp. AB050B]RKH72009.1 hypothetical protein D7X96_06565 [Corallococcus interemptor]RKI73324.1 hypothetical protein D7X55_05490 [Corallococcus sp. AB049A]
MSEYQCYEFIVLDRPLSPKQMAELRAISTRAEISPSRFWNEYHWGDLKADPAKLMERYFDAHLYFANWGTHRLMLRIPKARVALKQLKPYFDRGDAARLISTGEHVLLDLSSGIEEFEDDEQSPGSLAALSPLRSELMRGDLRPAYLAWLLGVSAGERDDDAEEPPVPSGLGDLSAAQEAMVEFLRIDPDLVAAAATGSAHMTADGTQLHQWLAALPVKQKDAWLKRAVEEPELALGGELLRVFRTTMKDERSGPRRTAGELRALAGTQRAARMKAEAARAKKARAASEAARARHLKKLAHDIEGAWAELERLVEASDYDGAVRLAIDLRDLAFRDAKGMAFARRFETLRKRQMRRRGFFDRWKRANPNGAANGWMR